jgi:PAS domain S-box-containing protein
MEETREQLDLSLLSLTAIIESSDDAIISKSLDGIIHSWNPAAERMFGYSVNEATGKHISLIIPDDLHLEEAIIIRRIKNGERVDHYHTTRCRKDGSCISVSITISPIKNSSGEVIGASKILRDITEQKNAEQKQAILASIIDSSDDAIISKTLGGIITSWNRGAENLFGYSGSEILGKHIKVLIPADLEAEEDIIINKIRKGERIQHYETIRKTKEGLNIFVSLTVSPIINRKGEIIGASKIARDITRQNIAEEKQAMLAAIVDSSDDAIISKNLNGVILSWNQGAEKTFGYTEKEIIGKHIFTIIPERLRSEEELIISKIRNGERINHFDTIRKTKDGSEKNISITVSPIKNSNGRIIGASKIARDITERINVEKQLREFTEKLQALNNAKDDFIGMASHELKTPLTSINAYMQLLQRNLVSDRDRGFVDKTVRQLGRLSNLVSDLLDVSKIQAGKLMLNFETVSLHGLLNESIEIVQNTVTSHHIACDFSVSDTTVTVDKHRIEQVIINLLTNAVKYSPESEKIIVTAINTAQDVIISVKDFGIGISRDHAEKIFSRFYRVEGLAPTFSGLGIGLYIAHEIVERHGGEMWVESQVGKGSTFYFKLPVKQQ